MGMVMVYYKQVKNVCVRILGSLAIAVNGFRVLLFVPPAPEILAEIKRAVYTVFTPSLSD